MAATNDQVRTAIHDAISLPGMQAYKYPPDTIEAPAAVVAGFEYTPSRFGEGRRIEATVLVAVSRQHVDQLEQLDRMLDDSGDDSILRAIDDAAVEGVSMSVQGVSGYGEVAFADVTYYGAVITVEVMT